MFVEAERAGTKAQEELKSAILLKSVSGQLKNYLNVHLHDGSQYHEIREQILKWDRAQVRWTQTLVNIDDGGPSPMEVDRIDAKGKTKGKSKDKGKSYKGDKSFNQKGKSKVIKGNSKSKGDKGMKGKGKSKDKGGAGQGKGSVCWNCGKPGTPSTSMLAESKSTGTSCGGA